MGLIKLIIIAVLGVTGYQLFKRYKKASTKERKTLLWQIAIASAILLLLVLVATGRLHWIGVVFAALLPLLKSAIGLIIRFFPLLKNLYHHANPLSVIQTQCLQVTFNRKTGAITGKVLSGPFQDQALEQMDDARLKQLMEFFAKEDPESAQLLNSYCNQRFQQSWQHQSSGTNTQASEVNREEALLILGLEEGADKADILHAHRRLMQKLHPDRGGNDYLASKVNAARDCLLK